MRAVEMNVRDHQVAWDATEGAERASARAHAALVDDEATVEDVLLHISTAMTALQRARDFVAGAKRPPSAEITPRVEA